MSEEKIIKHTQTAAHILADKEKTWRKKLMELAEEVGIIIFAVSITLAFHNWNDQRNEQKMEKNFLIGIKEDLNVEAKALDYEIIRLNRMARYYDTVWQQIISNKVDTDYVNIHGNNLTNTDYFKFDNGRFEGFKSSGNLRLIENQILLKHLTYLYTTLMPAQESFDELFYQNRKADYNNYIGIKAFTDSKRITHVSQLLNDPAVRYQITFYGNWMHERAQQKKELAGSIRSVITEIENELSK